MKPIDQRIAIAEAVIGGCLWHDQVNGAFHRTKPLKDSINESVKVLPDYLGDLNAIMEAVENLPVHKRNEFVTVLWQVVPGFDRDEREIVYFASINATAAQRSEAFLKSIGKWVDTP